jgi:hypothetical protein
MAQPQISINDTGRSFAIYDFHSGAKIGDLYNMELFVWAGYSMVSNYTGRYEDVYYAYTPSGWRMCRIFVGESTDYAYGSAFSSYYAQWAINSSRYVFYVRRQCRVFSGTTVIAYLYSGDAICTDGNSFGGSTYPYRLSINGYRKGGTWTYGTGLWCDTDIEIGYSTNPTVYGKGF